MLISAFAFGLAIGLVLGALGGGGSVLTVPVLVFALGLRAQDATTASLVIVGITAAVAAVGHARSGHTRWRYGLFLAAAAIPTSVLATRLNRLVDGNVLLLAFAVLMLVAAGGMLLRSRDGIQQDDAATGSAGGTATLVRPASVGTARSRGLRVLGAGLLIGALTGFFGVGGGFVIVPVLVVGLEFAMSAAVGTSLLVIALTSAVALAARAGHGSFDWAVIVPFTGAALVGSLGGQRLAVRLPAQALTRAFAVLLVLLAGYVAVRAGLGLR